MAAPASVPPPDFQDDPLPPARWPWQRSLQYRILFAYGAVFFVVLALLILWIGNAIYRADLEAGAHNLEVTAFLTANALQDPLSGFTDEFDRYRQWHDEQDEHGARPVPGAPAALFEDGESGSDDEEDRMSTSAPAMSAPVTPTSVALPRLQQVAEAYATNAAARITILDPNGNALADSHGAATAVANQGQQSEVQAALNNGMQTVLRSGTNGSGTAVFAAAPIKQGDRVLGVVQINRAVSDITADARRVLMNLALASLLALAVASALAFWIGRRLVKPLRDLEDAAIAVAGGDLTRTVAVTSGDEVGTLARAFNHMVREVRSLFAQQRAFVANASHELRTPLTNIKLRSEALLTLEGNDPALQQRYLEQIEGEADRLTRLANSLLDLSRLEDAAEPFAAEPVDLAPMLRNAAEMVQLQAQQAGLTLDVAIPAQLPPVRVDLDDVEAVVVNLVDNAIKYTPRGGHIRVTAAAQPVGVEIAVQDDGPGIPAEDLPHIFDRFYRVDKARSRRAGGTPGLGSGAGLGLSIVKQLVERNGGAIAVTPAPEQGVRFVVSFGAVA